MHRCVTGLEMSPGLEPAFTLTLQQSCTKKLLLVGVVIMLCSCLPCLTEEIHLSTTHFMWQSADLIMLDLTMVC